MGRMKFISCILYNCGANFSQLGRYEARKAEKERDNVEEMKMTQLDLLQARGFKAHL
jgi:hypothetical protein